MPFVSITVTTPTAAFQLRAGQIQDAPYKLNIYAHQTLLPESQARTNATINKDALPHRRPTDWQTEKQRRWWFAVGIHQWHGRTGKVRAWRVVLLVGVSTTEFRAENPIPYSAYVFGPLQQRMHQGVWQSRDVYAAGEGDALAAGVKRGWLMNTTGKP